jgi:O-antigen/teichoic acid export membrane protein
MLNRHFSIYLGAHIVPAIIGFFAITAYTRLLNPAEYGVYVVGMSVAGIFGAVFFTWIRLSVSRYQATSADVDFRGTAIMAFVLTVLAISSIAPFTVLLFHPNFSVNVLAAGMFVAVAVGAFEIGQEFERARLRPFRFAAIAVTRSVLGLGLGFLAIEMGWGGIGLIAAFGTSSLVGTIINLAGGGTQVSRWQRTQLVQFARYGLPLSIGGLTSALYSTSDRLIVAYLLGQEATGLFGVAADLPRQFMVMLASSVAAATFPIVFRTLSVEGAAATREKLNENIELLFAVVAPVTVWLALAADQVAGTLVGAEFRAGVSLLLPILAMARMLGVLNQFHLQISFQLAERPFLSVMQSCLTLVLGVVSMVLLIPKFGLLGAALATLITEAVGLVVAIHLTRRAFPLPFDMQRLAAVFASALTMGCAIYVAKLGVGGTGLLSLFSVSLAGGIAYATAAWLFDVARVRTLIMQMLRSRGLIYGGLASRGG